MDDFLQRMAKASTDRVRAARAIEAEASLAARAEAAPPALPLRLSGFDLIAELKRRSPAVGGLTGTTFDPARQLAAYAERLTAVGRLGEIEEATVRIGLGEYLAQIFGGIPISQGEIVRPSDLGLSAAAVAAPTASEYFR